MAAVQLADKEIERITTALNLWSNYIQTGTVTLSARDLAERNDPKRRPKSLDTEQMRFVVELADLRDKLLRAGAG